MEVGSTFDVISSPKHPYSIELLSNIPQITKQREPDKGHSLNTIVEHHPAMRGCIYRNVCPKVFARCVKAPALRAIGDGHSVSCFLYHNDETSDSTASGATISEPLAS